MTNTQEEYNAKVSEYNAQLDELDAKSKQWDEERRSKYEAERDDFKEQMSVWADNVEDNWDEFKSESSQMWNKMKAKWHSED